MLDPRIISLIFVAHFWQPNVLQEAIKLEEYEFCFEDKNIFLSKETIYRFANDGRKEKTSKQDLMWQLGMIENLQITFGEQLSEAIDKNQNFLKRKHRKHRLEGVQFVVKDKHLFHTLKQLKKDLKKNELSKYEFYRLKGKDGKGNVQFTAYFTPEIKVRSKPDDEFRFAFYKKPARHLFAGQYPSRKEIDGDKVLSGRHLELAWTKNPFDAFIMQVQGSGIVTFEDGRKKLLQFDGRNGHEYVSVGRLLVEDGHISAQDISLEKMQKWFSENPDQLEHYLFQNPSYIFFKAKGDKPVGASGVKLIPMHSIAVDPDIIPYGSILLARVPVLNEKQKLLHHEWRILFAHDAGSAIKGPAHIDLYMGIGDEAKEKASAMHHYGEVWIMLKR